MIWFVTDVWLIAPDFKWQLAGGSKSGDWRLFGGLMSWYRKAFDVKSSSSTKSEQHMLVQKLRLQHGWSQEQLADLSGVSVRTIQRIEQGKPASSESLKNLGAVLDVSFQELRDTTMNNAPTYTDTTITNEEALALRKVRKLRGFYAHAMQYAVVIPILAAINYFSGSHYPWVIWPALGWGLGLFFHGMRVHDKIPFLGAEWEKRQVEKYLGRKI